MLSTKIKNDMFERLSNVTMRKFFTPIKLKGATGLVKEVCLQSQRDFFINGTITSHAGSPELMAGMWIGGREIVLTNQTLPAWLKKAMGAALSEVNRCPYCEDMLLSLTHGAHQNNVANSLRKNQLENISDLSTAKKLKWIKSSLNKQAKELQNPPFSSSEMPEALGTLLVFNYTNKISDFTMNGSPVPKSLRSGALKLFGVELQDSAALELTHGSSLALLPQANLPEDLAWAKPNSLVANALARWNHVIEKSIQDVISLKNQTIIKQKLKTWEGGHAPLSRSWIEDEIKDVSEAEKNKARLALIIAKASYQVDDELIQKVVDDGNTTEVDLIKLGAWAAFQGAKTIAHWSNQN